VAPVPSHSTISLKFGMRE